MEKRKYNYGFEVDYEIYDCLDCPMRFRDVFNEMMDTNNKLTGTVRIEHMRSICKINREVIIHPKKCCGYDCPMKVEVKKTKE